jgi:hypothetical protein
VENGHRIVVEVLPRARGEFLENFLCPLVPSPPKVSGQLVQPRRQFSQFFARQRFFPHIMPVNSAAPNSLLSKVGRQSVVIPLGNRKCNPTMVQA